MWPALLQQSENRDFPVLIGLCEVENDTVIAISRFILRLRSDYRYVMTHSPDQRGIDVALLYQRDRFKLLTCSSIPVGNFENHRPTRDILHVSGLLLTGDTLDVLVVHLPLPLGRSTSIRTLSPFCGTKTEKCGRQPNVCPPFCQIDYYGRF